MSLIRLMINRHNKLIAPQPYIILADLITHLGVKQKAQSIHPLKHRLNSQIIKLFQTSKINSNQQDP